MSEELGRLEAACIRIVTLSPTGSHYVLARERFAALVERTEAGFGQIGSAGLMTERGLAVLVWRGEEPYFVAKGYERRAEAAEVAALREFSKDLQGALHPGSQA